MRGPVLLFHGNSVVARGWRAVSPVFRVSEKRVRGLLAQI